jgi:short-subunit dehydrogenase
MADFDGEWVLVTGAASGLGYEISKRMLDIEHANVIAVDRKPEIDCLFEHYGERVLPLRVDLTEERAAAEVFSRATTDRDIDMFINNAGVTHFGPTEGENLDHYRSMVRVNFLASFELILLFADYFRARQSGGILVVTSLAAFVPMPYQSVYGATKHALHSFCQALQIELRRTGVSISLFAPGGLNTPMFEESGLLAHNRNKPPFHHISPEKAARLAIAGFKRHRQLILPGFFTKVGFLATTLVPKWVTQRLIARSHQPRE